MQLSKTLRFLAKGDFACYTRPETKAERFSYEGPTASVARALAESISWKPAIKYHVQQICVQSPTKWISFRRNEVKSRASKEVALKGGLDASEDRTQRSTIALKDVSYVIDVKFSMTEKAGDGDNLLKFEKIFERRLKNGQEYSQPYFGCREFAANLLPFKGQLNPIDPQVVRPLGLMFYDFYYYKDKKNNNIKPPTPLFFEASLDKGIIYFPTFKEILKINKINKINQEDIK